ncbi:uncharacterized protein CMC5_023000 [Chondromyces crocatus]|uniref:Uncharacterized protein n=2 Tax=Chondromyces crocatus TaxID=52 RepID=A0A0K1EBV7_CHOCO|nr:uncharacterized protein CMC5_023000 [Chondromyces crocatus]
MHLAKLIVAISLAAPVLSSAPALANVVVYTANYPPTSAASEINGSLGGNTSRSLVAAGLMGAKFFGDVNVHGMEPVVLQHCAGRSHPNSTWPEQCDFKGLVEALGEVFDQNWLNIAYGQNEQHRAIQALVSGLKYYHSPAIVPLYGHVDHWGTVYQIEMNGNELSKLNFFDSGPGDQSDAAGDSYFDGIRTASGQTWRKMYYQVLGGVGPFDPFRNKFLISYDPPKHVMDEGKGLPRPTFIPVPLPGILEPGKKMDVHIAEERVWDAIFLAGIDDDPITWAALEKGMAGPAWEVHGRTPSGDAWDYFLVPILAYDGAISAMVQLSAADGAVEQIHAPSRLLPFAGLSEHEARARATATLMADEMLEGGRLTWDPQLHDAHCNSPLVPYYHFEVTSTLGEPRGGLFVALDDGIVRGIKVQLSRMP